MPSSTKTDRRPLDSIEAQALSQQVLADAFAAKLKRELGADGLDASETAFIAQVHEDCAVDEIAGLTAEDLACVALGFWEFAASRTPGKPKLRVVPAQGADGKGVGCDVLEIVQDDAPFL